MLLLAESKTQEKEMQLIGFEYLEFLTLIQVLVFNMTCGRYYHCRSEKLSVSSVITQRESNEAREAHVPSLYP